MHKNFTRVFFTISFYLFVCYSGWCQNSSSIIWEKTLGSNSSDILLTLTPSADGGYLLGGTSSSDKNNIKSSNSGGVPDFWIIKTDAEGNKKWD